MRNDFDEILDECLARLMTGESLDEVVKPYPELAAQLRPLLASALQVSSLPHPQPRPEAVAAGQRRMLQAFQKQHTQAAPKGIRALAAAITHWLAGLIPQQNVVPVFRLAVLATLLLAILTSPLAISASASSLPGDTLYLVKRSWERVQLTFTLNPQARIQLQEQFQVNRKDEIRTLVTQGREERVDFGGSVELIQAPDWVVGGITVHVSAETDIDGSAGVGQQVRVLAEVHSNGSLEALSVQVLEEKDRGSSRPPTATSTATASETPAFTGTPSGQHPETVTPTPTDKHQPVPTQTGDGHPGGRPTGERPTKTPKPHPTHETGKPTDRPGNNPRDNQTPLATPTTKR